MTRSITTSLKMNLGAVAFACLSLTVARAVPINSTGDSHLSPGTTVYALGDVDPTGPASPADDADHINGIVGFARGWSPDGPNGSMDGWKVRGHDDWDGDSGGWQYDSGRWHKWQRCEQVPDGGSTALLLAAGFLGLWLMRRGLSRTESSEAGNAA